MCRSNGCLSPLKAPFFFAVADGMGGHPGGGIASRHICDRLNGYYYNRIGEEKTSTSPKETSRRLMEAIFRADRHIRLQGLKNSRLKEMATTVSCMLLTPTHSIIAHVGDSRIYRLRNEYLNVTAVVIKLNRNHREPHRSGGHT